MPIRDGEVVPWEHKVELSDIWKRADLPLREQARIIVQRMEFLSREDTELAKLLSHLARSTNAERFNKWWARIYDWADANLVWINVHRRFAPKGESDAK